MNCSPKFDIDTLHPAASWPPPAGSANPHSSQGPTSQEQYAKASGRKAFGLDEETRELSANSGREVVKALDCR